MGSKTPAFFCQARLNAGLVATLALSASVAHAASTDTAVNGIDASDVGANARPSESGKLSNNLARVFEAQDESRGDLASMAASHGMQTAGDAIVLDVVLDRYASNLRTLLRRAGGRVRHVSEQYLRASVAVPGRDAAERIAEIPAVQRVYPSYGYVTNEGSVTSRAVDALDVTPIAGAPDNLDGTGQTVGILSDSFNRTSDVHDGNTTPEACNAGSLSGSKPQDSGDLPSSVDIRADDATGGDICPDDGVVSPGPLTDEGAAMAELVHDIAPDADLAFHTVGGSVGEFASGIDELCTASGSGGAGATVAVDDILFFDELMYQPDAVSQAVSDCEANGVPYFTSAGNLADRSFISNYTDVDTTNNDDDDTDGDGVPSSADDDDFHDWGSGDSTLSVTLDDNESFTAVLQWNQPALSTSQNSSNGPQIDLDLYLLNAETNIDLSNDVVVRSFQDQRFDEPSNGADPFELITYTNTSGAKQTLYLGVDHWAGNRGNIPQGTNPPLEFRLVFFERGELDFEQSPSDSPMYGHQQASAGASVGAVPWWEAPSFDPDNKGPTTDIDPEPFTSRGGSLTRFFNADGTFNESSTQQPAIAAVDGNNTTFFGVKGRTPQLDGEPDDFPNFFGTSAAAPNAAAVAALLQDYADGVAPNDIHEVLASTAIDVTGERARSGNDDTTGAGLIDADAARAKFPTADAGSDKTVVTGADDVALDGSGSSDDASLSAFAWTQVSGPTSVSITNADQQTASFDVPTSTTGTYEFKLSVEDSDGLTHADRVQVTVESNSDDGGGGGGAIAWLLLTTSCLGLIGRRRVTA